MLFAVNMPEHQPHVGQRRTFEFGELFGRDAVVARAIIGSMRSSLRMRALPSPVASTHQLARSWPPDTKTVRMLRRIAASSMPGVILSQFEMQEERRHSGRSPCT